MKTPYTLLPLLCLLVGCSAQPTASKLESAPASAPVQVAQAEAPTAGEAVAKAVSDAAPAPLTQPRKIIYTGEVTLVCEDLDKTAEQLEAKIAEFGGYLGNVSRSGVRGSAREGSWTARIPSAKFDTFVKALPSLGELQSSSRHAEDVSEEFYDVQARLKNKQLEEARLLDLLQKATGRLTEVLTVEKELMRVREEIERIQGRLRFLSNQTDLSTITITLREVKNFVPEGPPTLATQLSRSFSSSTTALKDFLVGVLVALVALLPWTVPLALLAWLIVRVVKKRR